MIEEILAYESYKVLRIHVAGDFYSLAYLLRWIQIATSLPNVNFWVYTKAWRGSYMLDALVQLAALPNVSLFFSTDLETYQVDGPPPYIPNVRIAHLRRSSKEIIPPEVDLVWTDRRGVITPEIGLRACPQGTGNLMLKTTCDKCRWCITKAISRRDLVTTTNNNARLEMACV
jgi:hypothetical protein